MSVKEAAQILELPTHRRGKDVFLNHCLCVSCDSPVFLGEDHFVCQSPDCKVKTGNMVDMIALHQQGYAKAFQFLRGRKEAQLAAIIGNTPWPTALKDLVADSLETRKPLEFFQKRQGTQAKDRSVGHLLTVISLRKRGIRDEVINRDFVVLNNADWIQLEDLFPTVNFPTLRADSGAAAVPFYGVNNELVSVMFYYGDDLGLMFKLPVSEHRVSFSGLLQAGNGPWDRLVLVKDPMKAAALNSGFSDRRVRHLALAVSSSGADPLTAHPDLSCGAEIVYAHDPDDSFHLGHDLHELMDCPVISIGHVDTPGTPVEVWPAYVYSQVLEHVLAEGQSLKPDYLRSVNLTQAQQVQLLSDVAARRSPAAAHWLKKVMGKCPVFEARKGNFIYAEPHGYSIGKHEHLTSICNFTLEFKANLLFEDTSEVLHQVVIKFNDIEVESSVSQRDLEFPRQLENKVRFACLPYLKNAAEEKLPVVFSAVHFKQLREYFANTIISLPNYHGIYNLGWDVRKATYTSRHWRYINGAVDNKSFHISPSSELLKMYQIDKVEPRTIPSTTKPQYPASVCHLLSILAALMARAYAGMDTIPVPVKNTPAARAVLAAVFRGFGQSSPLELGRTCDRMKLQLASFRGYPVYGTSEAVGELRSVGNPTLCVSEHGMNIEECDTSELSGHAAWFLQRMVDWLSLDDGKSVRHIPSVSWQLSLIMEGTRIMREALGIPWPDAELPFMALEKALQKIPAEQTNQFFTYDLDTQTVDFNFGALEVNPTDLELELIRITKSRSVKDGTATMDAVSAMQLLRSFYQREPNTAVRRKGVLGQDPSVIPLYVR